jgi:Toastrack DUF4097
MKYVLTLSAFVAALLATAPTEPSSAVPDERPSPGVKAGESARQDFEWRGRVAAGDAIEIKGISGDVRAVASTGRDVEVVAVKRGRSRDFDLVTFDVYQHSSGVTICAMYPPKHRHRAYECDRGGWNDVNVDDVHVDVDFEVRVPAGVAFVGRTISGDVTADGLSAEVEARSVSGDIDVSTTDIARASTVSGTIRASIGRSDWSGELALTTVSGDIWLAVPDGLNTEVAFSAVSGEMDSDFPITMQGRRFWTNHLEGVIGTGGRHLTLKTVSGDVRLRRRS